MRHAVGVSVVSLSHLEFDVLWERLDLGDRPYPIDVPSPGETVDERARLCERALQSLAEKGLHDGRELDPRLEDLLIMLVRNTFTVDAHLVGARELEILAAGRGERGVVAVQTGSDLRLRAVRDTNLVGEVVGLLPDEKPGPGGPVSMPRAVFRDATEAYARGGYAGLEAALNAGGVTGRDMRTVVTLVESPRHAAGQLAANGTDRTGRPARTPVLNWFDTAAGRYLVQPAPGRDREEWLLFTPGGSSRIAGRLVELIASVKGR
jgi:ESX secretion-associated protein EspG